MGVGLYLYAPRNADLARNISPEASPSIDVGTVDDEAAREIIADLEKQEEARKAEEIRKEEESVHPPGQIVDLPAPFASPTTGCQMADPSVVPPTLAIMCKLAAPEWLSAVEILDAEWFAEMIQSFVFKADSKSPLRIRLAPTPAVEPATTRMSSMKQSPGVLR